MELGRRCGSLDLDLGGELWTDESEHLDLVQQSDGERCRDLDLGGENWTDRSGRGALTDGSLVRQSDGGGTDGARSKMGLPEDTIVIVLVRERNHKEEEAARQDGVGGSGRAEGGHGCCHWGWERRGHRVAGDSVRIGRCELRGWGRGERQMLRGWEAVDGRWHRMIVVRRQMGGGIGRGPVDGRRHQMGGGGCKGRGRERLGRGWQGAGCGRW